MYRVISNVLVGGMLAFFTVTDIRTGHIRWSVAALVGALGIALHLAFSLPVTDCLWGLLPGALLLAISRLCGEAIGRGDCYAIAACGTVWGINGTMELTFMAVLFSAVWSILLLIKNRDFKQRFPFMPFLLAAGICYMVGG